MIRLADSPNEFEWIAEKKCLPANGQTFFRNSEKVQILYKSRKNQTNGKQKPVLRTVQKKARGEGFVFVWITQRAG